MNYEIFISTPLLAFSTGLIAMLGFLSGVLALAFYARLHDQSLLYFAMTILLTYPVFSLATPEECAGQHHLPLCLQFNLWGLLPYEL